MTTEQPHQGIEKLNKVAAQALGDDAYKQRLINEPEKVLTEAGLTVKPGTKVEVHENRADHIHLVLPVQPPGTHRLDPNENEVGGLTAGVHF